MAKIAAADGIVGWGEPLNRANSPAYADVAAVPSATVRVKVAGAPMACQPSYNAHDMVVIDERTIAYRPSAGRVYVNHMRNACTGLGGTTALVTRTLGPQTCSGDIAQVADLSTRMTVGSCVFGDFIPYSRPR